MAERCAARAQPQLIGPSQIAAQLEGQQDFHQAFFAAPFDPTAKLYGEFSAPAEPTRRWLTFRIPSW